MAKRVIYTLEFALDAPDDLCGTDEHGEIDCQCSECDSVMFQRLSPWLKNCSVTDNNVEFYSSSIWVSDD